MGPHAPARAPFFPRPGPIFLAGKSPLADLGLSAKAGGNIGAREMAPLGGRTPGLVSTARPPARPAGPGPLRVPDQSGKLRKGASLGGGGPVVELGPHGPNWREEKNVGFTPPQGQFSGFFRDRFRPIGAVWPRTFRPGPFHSWAPVPWKGRADGGNQLEKTFLLRGFWPFPRPGPHHGTGRGTSPLRPEIPGAGPPDRLFSHGNFLPFRPFSL